MAPLRRRIRWRRTLQWASRDRRRDSRRNRLLYPRNVVADTHRLRIRRLDVDDAPFILELVNEPSWIRFIGDKGVASVEDARRYIEKGPLAMYGRFGFGLFLVELKSTRTSIGICGLIKRDTLDDVDIGFAFLPRFWGNGYAFEAADAVLRLWQKRRRAVADRRDPFTGQREIE